MARPNNVQMICIAIVLAYNVNRKNVIDQGVVAIENIQLGLLVIGDTESSFNG